MNRKVNQDSPYAKAKRAAIAAFEKQYFEALLDEHQGNVSAASRACQVERSYLHRILKRHGIPTRGRRYSGKQKATPKAVNGYQDCA